MYRRWRCSINLLNFCLLFLKQPNWRYNFFKTLPVKYCILCFADWISIFEMFWHFVLTHEGVSNKMPEYKNLARLILNSQNMKRVSLLTVLKTASKNFWDVKQMYNSVRVKKSFQSLHNWYQVSHGRQKILSYFENYLTIDGRMIIDQLDIRNHLQLGLSLYPNSSDSKKLLIKCLKFSVMHS